MHRRGEPAIPRWVLFSLVGTDESLMPFELFLTPQGHLHVREVLDQGGATLDGAIGKRIQAAFTESPARGLLHLATTDLQSSLPPPFAYARDFARLYLTRLCQTPTDGERGALPSIPQPSETDLAFQILQAPPMQGSEYLSVDALATWWSELDSLVRKEVEHHAGGVQSYLSQLNPQWRLVGRVTFHLAENKRDPEHPFAFLATYIPRLSAQGRVQHEPLGKALQQYAGAKNRSALLSLLTPIQRATERSSLVKEMVETGEIYHPLAWTPREAYRFLQDIPVFEESGLVVRVPDWWKASHPPRPVVNVKIDARKGSQLSVSALLDFSVNVTLDGESLTESELERLLQSVGGLVALKGKWVEVDREKLAEALTHWKKVERETRASGLSFYDGMRLLSGTFKERGAASSADQDHEWVGLTAGAALEETLRKLRSPESLGGDDPPGLRAQLRHYQQTGVSWLKFVTGLGLGACLADDMGLGKTVQVIGLLLHRKSSREADGPTRAKSSLLVVPASLLANWKAELERFAPTLSFLIVHPSENSTAQHEAKRPDVRERDLLITTYGMLSREAWLRDHDWDLVILDEAQAIKNSGTRQSRTVKELKSTARVAMTGTPVENRLSDLWSLFDFLNPGLLGGAKTFADLVKQMEARSSYQPLRTLVGPYILRRLKTDKRVIADLPEKVEMSAFCNLSREQAAPLRTGSTRSGREAERSRRHPAERARLGPAHEAQADLQPPGPARRHWRLLARAQRQVPAPGRALRGAGRTPGEGPRFHTVPGDHRPACTFPRRRLRATRPRASWRDRGRSAATARRELSARGRAALLRALAQGRRYRTEPHRRLPRHPLRPLVEPRRREPGY